MIKNIMILVLSLILLLVLRMFQVEINANKELLIKDKQNLSANLILRGQVDNLLKEHKRLRKYFE